MTLIVGNVVDVGLRGIDGALRVWAWFRPEEVGLIAPYRREWEIRQGEIESGVDVVPGPAVVEVDCGPDAYTSVEVTVPDADSVSLKDLFEQVYSYTPSVVSDAYAERLRAEVAAVAAEESSGVALGAERGALAAESGAALSAATLSARVEQPGQDILYTSDGKPYFADPAQIENVPLRIDNTVGTRVFLGNVMIHGDTGWRRVYNASALWGPSVDRVFAGTSIRRVGQIVQFDFDFRAIADGVQNNDVWFMPPMGFRPSSGYGSRPFYSWPNDLYLTSGDGAFELRGPKIPGLNVVGGRMQWLVRPGEPWPTSLPGTPA